MENSHTVAQWVTESVPVPWVLDSVILEAHTSFNPLPNNEDLVLKKGDTGNRKCVFEKDPRKTPNIFLFRGWRDIKPQCSWSSCSPFFSCLIKKKCFFPSQIISFPDIWQWLFFHTTKNSITECKREKMLAALNNSYLPELLFPAAQAFPSFAGR